MAWGQSLQPPALWPGVNHLNLFGSAMALSITSTSSSVGNTEGEGKEMNG
jgi:hypothetical protein